MMSSSDQRSHVDRLIADGKPLEAEYEIAQLWRSDPSSAAFVVSRYKLIRSGLSLRPCKVAIERSFTLEPLENVCRAAAFVNGIDVTLRLGPFNAYAQDMLNPESGLYQFDPDVVFLAVLTSDVAPELWTWSARTPDAVAQGLMQRVVSHFQQLIETFRAHSARYLVVHLLERPAYPNQGILDNQTLVSQMAIIGRINDELRRLACRQKGVYTLDYDGLISRVGSLNWRDEAKWEAVRLPIRSEFHRLLAQEWLKFLHPISGRIAKLVAVDLDNTLWGGVIGEDGLAGIKLGKEYPGAAYRSLQQALLDLRERGLLLAVCSKNNIDDAMEAFDKHPEMLLKREDFAALRINWNDKVSNLRAIASELNVGLESIAFVDDNPVERQQVRSVLPEVQIVELPENPTQFESIVRNFPAFERLALSEEDRERSLYYAAHERALELRSQSKTLEEFYHFLHQRVVIQAITPLTLTRVAQLTQKTNQFNLTTRRYSEQQIQAFATRSGWRAYTIRVIDRYADNGLVGVAFTIDSQDTCEIETFLLSCRVIGRGIETALLARIVEEARQRGMRHLKGRFIPTKKNRPAHTFFRDNGFAPLDETSEGVAWQLDLQRGNVPWPAWIELLEAEATV